MRIKATVIEFKNEYEAEIIFETRDRVLRRIIRRIAKDFIEKCVRMFVDDEDDETITVVAYDVCREEEFSIDYILREIEKELGSIKVREVEIRTEEEEE